MPRKIKMQDTDRPKMIKFCMSNKKKERFYLKYMGQDVTRAKIDWKKFPCSQDFARWEVNRMKA